MTTINTTALAGRYTGASAPASAALQATLEQLQHQLSDCVNCATAGTDQGKADIANIKAQIGAVEQSLARPRTSPAQADPAPPAPDQVSAPSPLVLIGSRIDVFA
jgi:hypothetical protein